ncbi:MAG TPA: hypothetical protein VHG92_06540 [Afifellaceae bacterium]|nr:hypothetical protein [Afifellaceae bacterium]
MTITIHAQKPAGDFEALHPRAPFAELIRLTLIVADALGRIRRGETTGHEAARPAVAA